MGAYALSFVAGSLTTLNPCVLPLLPIVLASAAQENRWAPAVLIAGLLVSFVTFGTLIAAVGFGLGFDPLWIRYVAGALLIAVGAVLISRKLSARFADVATPLTGGASAVLTRYTPSGVQGQFVVGIILGAVWTPCVGPTLGAAVGLAATRDTFPEALALMIAFGIGLGLVMALLAYGSRKAILARKSGLRNLSRWGRPIMGGAVLFVGVAVVSGFDMVLEGALVTVMPDWLATFTTSI